MPSSAYAVLLLVIGCAAEPVVDSDCGAPLVSTPLAPANTDQLDILFMIDTSGGLLSEQAVFARALPEFFSQLSANPPQNAARDIQVGFVTSDMGVGGQPVPTCEESYFGDDGLLFRSGGGPSCGDVIAPGALPFLSFRLGSDVADFASDAACLTSIGDRGCGLEQPLEAVLKALTPSSSALRFAMDTVGHGTAANDGFLRNDSVLAVILLTDEDDCAIRDPELFDLNSTVYTEPNLSLRCFRYGDPSVGAVHPIERFVDGLLALRSPRRLVFAAIAGVPEDLVSTTGDDTPWDALAGDESVRDPRMIVTIDPNSSQQSPVCDSGSGAAHAGLRIASVARDLEAKGALTSVHSICAESYSPAMTLIVGQILDGMSGACLDAPLDTDTDGVARCAMVEALSEGACEGRHGRVPHGMSDEGETVCKICQGDVDGEVIDDDPACRALGESGWVYQEGESSTCPSEGPGSIDFSPLLPTSPRMVCPDPAHVCD